MRLGFSGVVEFVIDTSAEITTVGPADAINRLGVPPDTLADPGQWPDKAGANGVGEGAVLLFTEAAIYQFSEAVGAPTVIQQSNCLIHLSIPRRTFHLYSAWTCCATSTSMG